jgi:hypothetical protein
MTNSIGSTETKTPARPKISAFPKCYLEEISQKKSMSVFDLIEMAKGNYANGHQREGIVVRPVKEMHSKILNGRLSFKVINNDYLLNGGE